MVAQTEIFLSHTEVKKEVLTVGTPVIEPFEVSSGLTEEFKLHLFEFTCTENEVSGCYFVSEGFTDLCNTERYLFTRGTLNILEVYKNTLCCFGTEIYLVRAVFGNTDEGLEHKVELTDSCEIAASAVGAGNVIFLDIFAHLIACPAVRVDIKSLFVYIVLNKLIRAMTATANLTVHKGIGKSCKMSRCYPCLGVHNNCAVKTYVIGRFLNEFLPPSLFNVVFELYAERTVIPRV